MGQAQYWERVCLEREPREVSWYEEVPKSSLGGWCQTPLLRTRENGSHDQRAESPSKPFKLTSATYLVPEDAQFELADRDLTNNTSLLALIKEAAVPLDAAIVDVGGGKSKLAGLLVVAGYSDVTVADISGAALERARVELGAAADQVTWIEADVRSHDFARVFDLWHDRAVFHFMIEPADRDAYLAALRRTVAPGGHVVLATFGPGGPIECSGLPVARYGADELTDILGLGFELVSSRTEQHRTPGGHRQEFTYTQFQPATTSPLNRDRQLSLLARSSSAGVPRSD